MADYNFRRYVEEYHSPRFIRTQGSDKKNMN